MTHSWVDWHIPARRNGLLVGGLLILYGVLFRLLQFENIPILLWLFYLAPPLAAFLACRASKAANDVLSYKDGFKTALGAALLAGLLYCVYVFLFNQFLDDSLIRGIAAGTRQDLRNMGNTREEAEALVAAAFFLKPLGFSLYLFAQMALVGFASALVIPFVMRTKEPAGEKGS